MRRESFFPGKCASRPRGRAQAGRYRLSALRQGWPERPGRFCSRRSGRHSRVTAKRSTCPDDCDRSAGSIRQPADDRHFGAASGRKHFGKDQIVEDGEDLPRDIGLLGGKKIRGSFFQIARDGVLAAGLAEYRAETASADARCARGASALRRSAAEPAACANSRPMLLVERRGRRERHRAWRFGRSGLPQPRRKFAPARRHRRHRRRCALWPLFARGPAIQQDFFLILPLRQRATDRVRRASDRTSSLSGVYS